MLATLVRADRGGPAGCPSGRASEVQYASYLVPRVTLRIIGDVAHPGLVVLALPIVVRSAQSLCVCRTHLCVLIMCAAHGGRDAIFSSSSSFFLRLFFSSREIFVYVPVQRSTCDVMVCGDVGLHRRKLHCLSVCLTLAHGRWGATSGRGLENARVSRGGVFVSKKETDLKKTGTGSRQSFDTHHLRGGPPLL